MRHLHHNLTNITRRLNLVATGTALLIAAGVAAAAAAASTTVSAVNASKERQQQKNMLADADKKAKELEAKTVGAAAAADQAAKDKVLAKKRALTPTILTSPLGAIDDSASGTTRPTLLGGGQ